MTEKTKKTLVISGACVICAALLTGIGLRFSAGDSPAQKVSVKTRTEQTEPVVNIDSTVESPKPSAEKLETTKSPTVKKLHTSKTDIGEKTDPSTGAVDTGTEQTIQPDPVKPSITPPPPQPSAPAYQSGQDHEAEDVPQEERDLEEPPAYEETPVYEPPQPTPAPETPSAGDTNSGGQVYVPGFGYVSDGGGNQVTTDTNMYENGNKIGIMGGE